MGRDKLHRLAVSRGYDDQAKKGIFYQLKYITISKPTVVARKPFDIVAADNRIQVLHFEYCCTDLFSE